MNSDSKKILSEIATELEKAWNAADGERFGAAFTEDADFVTIRGEHLRTRKVIADGHQAIFDSIYKSSVLRFEIESVRVIAPLVLLGHIKGTMDAPSGPLAGRNNAFATLVLVEQQGVWRIAAFHNMLLRPPQ